MTIRVKDPSEALRVLTKLWSERRYFVWFFSLLYLYPTLTKHFMNKFDFHPSDLGAFFATSFFIVIVWLVLGILFKHIIVFIPAFVCFGFLFLSFMAYLVMNPPGDS